MRPAFIEVDRDAIRHNLSSLRSFLGNEVKILACVKANAYGHGMMEIARLLQEEGVDFLGVAHPHEGVQLRDAGVEAPILVLSSFFPEEAEYIVSYNLHQSVESLALCRVLDKVAKQLGKKAFIHINVDTGMGRLGVLPEELPKFLAEASELKNVEICGLYTHFSSAESDEDFTLAQLSLFNELLNTLSAQGYRPPLIHAANSAATVRFPQTHFDMVRVGLLIYGISPIRGQPLPLPLRPALSLHTKILSLRHLPEGTSISYNHTYTLKRSSIIATVPIGYGDGYIVQYSNKAHVLVRGKRCPVIGRICMDLLLIDVTDVEGVQIGDTVTLIGKQGDERISVEELAHLIDITPHQVTTLLKGRLYRLFKGVPHKPKKFDRKDTLAYNP